MFTNQRAYSLWAILFIALLSISRIYLALNVGLGDAEAYYARWAEELALSYFDHGPLTAWTIALSTKIFGLTPFGVRALFIFISALGLWLYFCLTRLILLSDRLAFYGILILSSLPAFLIAGAAANPDVLTITLLIGVLYLHTRYRTAGSLRANILFAITIGFLIGLLGLAKIYGILIFIPHAFDSIKSSKSTKLLLITLFSSILVLSPLIYWNVNYAFPMFDYQLFGRHQDHILGPSFVNLIKLIGGQLAYIGFIQYPLLLLAIYSYMRLRFKNNTLDPNREFHLYSALIYLIFGYLLMIWIPSAEPHWPALGYISAVILLLDRYQRQSKIKQKRFNCLLFAAFIFSLLLYIGFNVHLLSDRIIALLPNSYQPRYDLSNELYGWTTVAKKLNPYIKPSPKTKRPRYIAGAHYTVCSQLDIAKRMSDLDYPVICPSARKDQYDYFNTGDGSNMRGIDVIYLKDPRFNFSARLLYHCNSYQKLDSFTLYRAKRAIKRYEIWLCEDFQGLNAKTWPPKSLVVGQAKD